MSSEKLEMLLRSAKVAYFLYLIDRSLVTAGRDLIPFQKVSAEWVCDVDLFATDILAAQTQFATHVHHGRLFLGHIRAASLLYVGHPHFKP